jgi:hypothetical protein
VAKGVQAKVMAANALVERSDERKVEEKHHENFFGACSSTPIGSSVIVLLMALA